MRSVAWLAASMFTPASLYVIELDIGGFEIKRQKAKGKRQKWKAERKN
jgi:hypothetical protein